MIILIIFFIVIAIIVVKSIIDSGNCAKIALFIDDIEGDVRRTWNYGFDEHTFKAGLPNSIDFVCFANLTNPIKGEFEFVYEQIDIFEGKQANMFFYPISKSCEIPYQNIKHVNLEKLIERKNPNCFEVEDGKVSINIEKRLNEKLVRLK